MLLLSKWGRQHLTSYNGSIFDIHVLQHVSAAVVGNVFMLLGFVTENVDTSGMPVNI
jgi:hypothetical protein